MLGCREGGGRLWTCKRKLLLEESELSQPIGLGRFPAKGLELCDGLAKVGDLDFLRFDFQSASGGERLCVASSVSLGRELRVDLGQRVRGRIGLVVKLE